MTNNYLRQLAIKETINEIALMLSSFEMWDFAGAANHFASATMWGALHGDVIKEKNNSSSLSSSRE